MEDLRAERERLAEAAYNLYDPDDRPGSRKAQDYWAAEKAIMAFDAAHPEVKAEIEAEQAAERRAAAKTAGWI